MTTLPKTSSAGIWTKCPASVPLSRQHEIPNANSDVRREGTAAHKVIEMMASGMEVKEGQLTKDGTPITDIMIEGAELFFQTVDSGAMHETKVDCSAVLPGLVAYPDAFKYDERQQEVHIWDYKFGHSFVDAFENAQMLVECSAFVNKKVRKFVMHVIQPRCFHAAPVRSWEVTYETYMNHWLPILQTAAKDSQSTDAEMQTGPHCKMCPARHACSLLRSTGYSAIDASLDGPTAEVLDNNALGMELRLLHDAVHRIEARIKGLEEQAKHEMQNGGAVYGYELKQSYGHADWMIDKDAVLATGDALGLDLRKPAAPVSPSQAKKLGFDAKAIERITQRPFRGYNLKPIDMNKMKGVFGNGK